MGLFNNLRRDIAKYRWEKRIERKERLIYTKPAKEIRKSRSRWYLIFCLGLGLTQVYGMFYISTFFTNNAWWVTPTIITMWLSGIVTCIGILYHLLTILE